MYTITYETKIYKQWESEYVFNSFAEAKDYLLENGFIEKNRIYERINYGWSKYLKAYINLKKIYKGDVK